MNCFVGRTAKFWSLMRDLFVSAIGCFVFVRGFDAAAMEEELETGSSVRAAGTSR
jgi:hypothetical protein